jgi:formylglycine-generating enzyme required for sulfatase activity
MGISRAIRALIYLLVISFIFGIVGCISPPEEEEVVDNFVIAENSNIINDSQVDILNSYSESSLTFNSDGLDVPVEPGQVVVYRGDTLGFLRKVLQVTEVGGETIVETENACLADLIESGHFDTTITLSMEELQRQVLERPKSLRMAKGVKATEWGWDLSGTVLFSGEKNGTSLTVDIPSGGIFFEPSINIDVDFSWNRLTSFEFVVGGELEAGLDLRAQVDDVLQFSNEDDPFELASYAHYSWVWMGAPVLIVTRLSFDAYYSIDYATHGYMQSGFNTITTIEAGKRWENGTGWEDILDHTFSAEYHPFEWDAEQSMEIKGAVDPKLSVELYDLGGPYLRLDPYLKLKYSIDANPPTWDFGIYWGFDAYLGVGIEVFDLEILDIPEWQFFDHEAPLYENGGSENSNSSPTAFFTVSNQQGNPSTLFEFDASLSTDVEDATADLQVQWDWEGDGVWDTGLQVGKIIQYQYPLDGVYQTTCNVVDTEGSSNNYSREIIINSNNLPPIAEFEIDPPWGSTQTIFEFDASFSSDTDNNNDELQFRWDFEDDGSWDTEYSSNPTTTHQYPSEGGYIVRLSVRDSDNAEDEVAHNLAVQVAAGAWALIPAGDYTFGPESEILNDINYNFEMMVYEVTNQQYLEFLENAILTGDVWLNSSNSDILGNYPGDDGLSEGVYSFLDLNDTESRITWNGSELTIEEGYLNHPVVEVSWFGAWAFAQYNGFRLPNEHEWEKAARGISGSRYPWGDEAPSCSLANYYGCYEGTLEVGLTTGLSYYSISDMAGNAEEWTATAVSEGSSYRLLKGGSWTVSAQSIETYDSYSHGASVSLKNLGFRCVRDSD